MKKLICVLGIVVVLLAGTLAVCADPWGEPSTDNATKVIVITESHPELNND